MAHISVVGAGVGGVPRAASATHQVAGKLEIHRGYFLRKVRTGSVTSVHEKYVLQLLGIVALKANRQ